MKDTYSFNDILRASLNECSLIFEQLFINTENNEVLGYLYAKCPSDIRNGGHLTFKSPCRSYFYKIYGNNFIKNSKILKIIKQ